MNLKNSTIIVNGASRGIGREICLLLAKEKSNVVAVSRSKADVVNEIKKQGGNAIYIKADISNEKQMENVFIKTKKHFKKIDALVNNAGVLFHKPLEKTNYKEIDLMLNINIRGTIIGCKLAKKYIKKGIIVNAASVAGLPHHGQKEIATYNATKFGIIGLTEALGKEFKPNIKVYAVAPHRVATGMSGFKGNPPKAIARVYIRVLKENAGIKTGEHIIAGTLKCANTKKCVS